VCSGFGDVRMETQQRIHLRPGARHESAIFASCIYHGQHSTCNPYRQKLLATQKVPRLSEMMAMHKTDDNGGRSALRHDITLACG
jgi:hypothetical protein